MFCKKCGKQLKGGAQFCIYCGQKVVMPGASVQPKQPVERVSAPKPAVLAKPVESASTPKPVQSGKKMVNLIPWIVVGILVIVVAVMGYFIFSGRSKKPAEDDETIEAMQDSAEEAAQEPVSSEDEGYVAPAEEPRESKPAEESEEEELEKEEISQYFLPTSNSEYLTMSDLEGFLEADCRIARNELYARHGRRFDDANLQAYFDACDWYEGTIAPADFDESVMNEYEIANRDLIVQYEKNMGYR